MHKLKRLKLLLHHLYHRFCFLVFYSQSFYTKYTVYYKHSRKKHDVTRLVTPDVVRHPWETVVLAAWRKYPNPMNPSVTGIDTIDRSVDTAGKLQSHRVLSTEWGLPSWVTKLVGFDRACYVSEHSEVDPSKKVMTLRSRNLTFCNIVTIDEQVVYSPHPADSNCTLFRSESFVTVEGIPMKDYMENLIKGTMSSKANQGRQAIEWVISKIKTETHDIGQAARVPTSL